MKRTVKAWKFEFQIDYEQYWNGVSTMHTPWDEVYVGIGNSEQIAAEEAMEDWAQANDTSIPLAIEREAGGFSPKVVVDETNPSTEQVYCYLFVKFEGRHEGRFQAPAL